MSLDGCKDNKLIYEGDLNTCDINYQRTSEVAESCPTLCDPKDCSPPGSSVHGILQARTLEWVALSFSGDLPDPGSNPGLSRLLRGGGSLPLGPPVAG